MSLPDSVVNLKHLSHLDCSGCSSLTEIPKNIGFLPPLRELSLQEMVAKYLKVKSIPQLPPHINQLLAFDCPSIKRVMSNSNSTRIDLNLLSDSNETGAFKFHFTNSQEPDVLIVSAFFCLPGSAVPTWFPYRCQGLSVTAKKDSRLVQ
ncbi:disease resistance protein (TIR-NBS-LRR class), putative [Medicago truncatula]|uniref:Disease resistance protein (TIR-NBS-LRR class), putative n=1 Tax=Medicago truncatula TaxID=3880 RepID=G7L908_MEDTR|nr:disease resistance protein (TIR-NBS-LRR class), putative [Medicago truncatula]